MNIKTKIVVGIIFIILYGNLLALDFEKSNYKVLEIEVDNNGNKIEPSGLIKIGEYFYTVSILMIIRFFRIELSDNSGKIYKEDKLKIPKKLKNEKLDFEGITLLENGKLAVLSELTGEILIIEEDSLKSLIKVDVEKYTNLEGIAYSNKYGVIIANKKNKTGLLFIEDNKETFIKIKSKELGFNKNKEIEISDIYCDGDVIWCLFNNIKMVIGIKIDEFYKISVVNKYDYSYIEDNPEYKYSFYKGEGFAEGLYVDDEKIYIILDNNGVARLNNKTNINPQMIVLKR